MLLAKPFVQSHHKRDGITHNQFCLMRPYTDLSRRGNLRCWMMGKIVREVKVAIEPEALLAVLKSPRTASSELDWKPGRYRNGCPALSPKQSYRWSVLKRGTCSRC